MAIKFAGDTHMTGHSSLTSPRDSYHLEDV